jgi:outer membrane protein assembly factor BamB
LKRLLISLVGLALLGAGAVVLVRQWPTLPWATPKLEPNDWPHFRGPARDDVSRETGLLKQWPAGGPKQLWLSREVGIGYAGPAIAAGRLFTAGAEGKTEYLHCLDAATGKKQWSTRIGDLYKNDMGNGPRGTPTIDGARVYVLSGEGNLVCARVRDGKLLWQHDLLDFDGKPPRWGYSESVLIDGDQAVCTPGAPGGTVAAFDKTSGKLRWLSKEITDPAHYSSLTPMDLNGQRQYVQVTKTRVFAVSAKDGKLLWQHPFPGVTVIPSPIVRAPYVYVTAGQGSGCLLLKIGPGNTVEKVYQNRVMKNHHGGVVLIGDYLYGHSDPSGWICQNFLTGEQVWAERTVLGKGSLTYADGMLYAVDEEKGDVVLAEVSPKGWREAGRFQLSPQSKQRSTSGRIWTHPVVAQGRLYLRDQELQYCFDVRAR